MSITLYELAGAGEIRMSPFCWRTRYALAHKGLPADLVPVKFTEKDKIAFSSQPLVPVIRDGETVVSDSWKIACYLEETYPDRPSLFGGATGRSFARYLNFWAEKVFHPSMGGMLMLDVFEHLDPADKAYFRESREKRLGKRLEDIPVGRDERVVTYRASLEPLRALLAEQPFLAGAQPAYHDYIVFGHFMWARSISPFKLLAGDDPIHAWRERMAGLFGGLGAKAKGYAF